MRPLGMTLVAFLLTLVLAYVLGSIAQTILNGGDLYSAIFSEAWRVLFSGGFVASGLFLLFLFVIYVAARRRGSGTLFWVAAGALVIAILLGTVVTIAAGVVVGALSADLTWLGSLSAVLAAGELFVGGLIALAITHFAIFRSHLSPPPV